MPNGESSECPTLESAGLPADADVVPAWEVLTMESVQHSAASSLQCIHVPAMCVEERMAASPAHRFGASTFRDQRWSSSKRRSRYPIQRGLSRDEEN